MTEWLQEKSLMLETKSFFIIRVWNFFLENCALVGPYGAVEITSLETNKVLKVNGYRLQPFYEGWMA